jgi:pyroglutamyl-peptidase
MTTILVTGFGPFPGAPFNPTGPLVARLARLRRPALADVRVVAHVFPTSYAAVDQEMPELVAKHRPQALLMFGLASRAKTVRIEMRARNALALLPDASGQSLPRTSIHMGGPAALALSGRAHHLLHVARVAQVPVVLSRDAGRYLCNYLCWRAAEAAEKGTLRIAAFVHVPPVRRSARPKKPGKRPLTLDDLTRTGSRLLAALAAAARR